MIAEEVENYLYFVGNKNEILCPSCSKPDRINYIQSVQSVCHHCTINCDNLLLVFAAEVTLH
jgi:NMD protein affecting ribosome stability and mRNA decay